MISNHLHRRRPLEPIAHMLVRLGELIANPKDEEKTAYCYANEAYYPSALHEGSSWGQSRIPSRQLVDNTKCSPRFLRIT